MKRVAIVGFGFMGRTHFGAWKKLRGAKVAAICDSNLAQLKNKVTGNGKDADTTTDFTGIDIYDDFDKMLASAKLDIIDITLPTPLHPVMAVKALEKGFAVLCEKPMAVDAKTCDTMLAAAKRTKGFLMIAQCLRFDPQITWLKNLVDSGKYGKVTAANFSRISMTPGWAGGGKSWFLDESKSGGVALDLHIHDTDLVHYLLGMPEAVTSRAHWRPDGVMDEITTSYLYKDKVVTAEGNWGAVPSFVFESNFRIMFERAVVVSDEKRAQAFTVFPDKGKPFQPKLSTATAYEIEVKQFLVALEGKGKLPMTPRDARNSVAIVDAEKKSARAGGKKVGLGIRK